MIKKYEPWFNRLGIFPEPLQPMNPRNSTEPDTANDPVSSMIFAALVLVAFSLPDQQFQISLYVFHIIHNSEP